MKSKRVHKKPIGENGPVRVTNMGGQPDVEWRKIDYPPEKRPMELAVATSFVTALNATESSAWELTALQENDFDFEMRSQDGKRYLERQEAVIPRGHLTNIFPNEELLKGFDPNQVQRNKYVNFDPAGAVPITRGSD